ncbi:MAG: hypothetical protein AB7I59_22570 [Geminicoccaceae bacterium]
MVRRATASLGILARHPGGAVALLAMLLAVLAPPLVTYELAWEIASALGYVGAAAAVLCMLVRPAPGMPQRAYRFAMHRAAGDALVLLALLHVVVMVAADPFMLDYLGWMMPPHVMVGAVATVLLALVALGREPAFPRRPSWLGGAGFHAWAGILGALLVAVHVVWSSTRLTADWRALAIVGALAVPPLLATILRVSGRGPRPARPGGGRRPPRIGTATALVALLACLLVVFLGVPLLVALGRG